MIPWSLRQCWSHLANMSNAWLLINLILLFLDVVTIPTDSWRHEGLHFPRPTTTETAVAAVPGAEGVGRVEDVVRLDTWFHMISYDLIIPHSISPAGPAAMGSVLQQDSTAIGLGLVWDGLATACSCGRIVVCREYCYLWQTILWSSLAAYNMMNIFELSTSSPRSWAKPFGHWCSMSRVSCLLRDDSGCGSRTQERCEGNTDGDSWPLTCKIFIFFLPEFVAKKTAQWVDVCFLAVAAATVLFFLLKDSFRSSV